MDSGSLGRCGFTRFVDDRGCRALCRMLARKRVLISACESETQIVCTHVVYLPSPTLILRIQSTNPYNHNQLCAPYAIQLEQLKSQVGHLGRFRLTRILASPSVGQDSLGTRTPKYRSRGSSPISTRFVSYRSIVLLYDDNHLASCILMCDEDFYICILERCSEALGE